ncbi:MAG: hypothetical protein GKR89_26595 [Candidatus Latescibacteria bacterium]|nr:hypothetical protein [Candidatus Latescibacterota bacterium]
MQLDVEQITFGPNNHIFGYIGHAGTIPWNGTNRYILALEVPFQDHMPGPGEAATICLLDTHKGYAVEPLDSTCGWNPQQGTMFYWNPEQPDSQFFFNDRDPDTQKIFTVLYDIAQRRRIRQYRYDDTPCGNSGVAQRGGQFLGLNYARMARLRRVTGYVGAWDWTEGVAHPTDDGIHRVDVATGQRDLIVSFADLAAILRQEQGPEIPPLFINHTLWNRDDDRIYFYARGGWGGQPGQRINQPFTVAPNGTGLTPQSVFIGGHPEWAEGRHALGGHDGRLAVYDTDAQQIVDYIADPTIIPDPGGDSALSPNGDLLVTGYGVAEGNQWVVYSRKDGTWVRTDPYSRGQYTRGDLRCDSAPCWNRDSSQILVPAIAADGTRQLYLIHLRGC